MPTTLVTEETRRRAPRLPLPATGVIGGTSAVGVAYAGAPWWVLLCSVLCAAIAYLPALLPQKSEHRRDVLRDLLRHRERMYRLRREPPRQPAEGRTE
ncbi:hypothetical protein ACFU8Q_36895 [Streptomyces sp. NPDC057543]|uniref:hypothetical protein n=1 Tax=Streptomyces sp. NPDC057543 TaxID=3346163 RepID=UPI003690846B